MKVTECLSGDTVESFDVTVGYPNGNKEYYFVTFTTITNIGYTEVDVRSEYGDRVHEDTELYNTIMEAVENHCSDEAEPPKRNYGERVFSPTARELSFARWCAVVSKDMIEDCEDENLSNFNIHLNELKEAIESYEVLSKRTQASEEESQTTG